MKTVYRRQLITTGNYGPIEAVQLDSINQVWGQDLTGRSCVVARFEQGTSIYKSIHRDRCKWFKSSGYVWSLNSDYLTEI
jgi:hypothetical protein